MPVVRTLSPTDRRSCTHVPVMRTLSLTDRYSMCDRYSNTQVPVMRTLTDRYGNAQMPVMRTPSLSVSRNTLRPSDVWRSVHGAAPVSLGVARGSGPLSTGNAVSEVDSRYSPD